MQILSCFRIALLAVLFAVTSCSSYSSVSEKRPAYRAASPAGEMIVQAMRRPTKEPEVQIGRFIDAAADAGTVLRKSPDDEQARKDYNFAIGRIFEVIHDSGVTPWKKPLVCPGVDGDWKFSMTHDGKPEHDPSHFRVLPTDRFQFKGSLVKDRTIKDGLGAPMVMATKGTGPTNFDPTKLDPFIQGKNIYYGVTEVLQFNGKSCTAAYVDPLSTETVKFAGHTYPVAADFSAPLALSLAELKPRKRELANMFKPEDLKSSSRLARLQPYDPRKIPILCIHGLGDSHATWAPLIESIRGDATLRKDYQVWFFSYPTGYPYPLVAAILRRKMDAINAYYPGHKKVVVIGHSMGGMITRTLLTDSGMKLWDSYWDKPPAEMPFPADVRKLMADALIFRHRPEISRVIFASASHRGSKVATNFIGRLGAKIIGGAADWVHSDTRVVQMAKPPPTGKPLERLPNSIDFLNPDNRFVATLATLPITKGVPYHSIIGDRGKGGNLDRTEPVSFDGLVPYWSSHIEGAASEVVIPSDHWTHQHPMGIAEVKRILLLHLGKR